jgi:hypothetical protein
MRIRVLSVLLAISSGAIAQDEWPVSRRGELGVRWWVSTGETKISHNAQVLNPAFGNPTSVLVYENLDANTFELFARQNLRNDLFLKVLFGAGQINRGSFDDEDFSAGQIKTSDTNSSVTQGRIGYGIVDFGYHWVFGEGAVTLGVFGGFAQWVEDYDAYGSTTTVGNIPNLSRDINVISNKVRWRALRAGFAGQFALGRARLGVDLALVPYGRLHNQDSHHLRDDLGPVPNIIDEGEAWGVQFDAELRYELMRRTEIGVGWRFWYLEVRDGTTDFRNFNFAEEAPLVDFYTRRYGLTFSLRRTW